jgi:lysophospholipase L1-like esterase
MAVIETWLHQDLQEPVKVNHLDGNLFSNNGNGNRIGVVLTNNGEDLASISGTVSGYVVTSDGSTVPCTGSKSGNRASILIPAAAYQPGAIFISVFITDGTTVTTVAAVSSTVMRTRTNAQVDPGSAVTDWTQTINAAMQSVETAAANLGGIVAVPYASITFPVPLGKYTYYNNNLYRCITPIESSESFTAAHWTQVRLGDDVSDLKSAFNWYSKNIASQYTVLENMYIDGSTHYLRIGAGDNRAVCIRGEANTKYIFHKGTSTVVRIGCGESNTPSNQTYVYNYTTNGTASNDEIEFETQPGKPYIYIQLFVDGDDSAYKSISANIGSVVVIKKDETTERIDAVYNELKTDIDTVNNAFDEYLGIEPTVNPDLINGSFVNATNNAINTSSGFAMTVPMAIKKGQTVVLNAAGYNTLVGMIATCNTDNSQRTVVSASIDSNLHEYKYTAQENGYVVCSFNSNTSHTISISIDYFELASLSSEISQALDRLNAPIQYPQLFDKIICMGDSLTQGQSGGSKSVPLAKNYPHFFEKLAQSDITNQSQGGITSEGFWNTFASSYDYTPFDCAIIFLGTNGGLTDTVATDCHADYTQNANTQTGYYGRIIGRIKEIAPNCHIFLVAGVNDYVRRATTMNPAVRALASFYNVGLVDIENCIMSDNGGSSTTERWLYRPVDGIHYNALGYMTMANLIYDAMSIYMSNNRTKYDDYNSN